MNTQNESLVVTGTGKYKKLEALPEEKLAVVLELAQETRLVDLVEILKEHGIETTRSTLSRFLRKHKEKEVLEEGEEMRETVETLARRGAGESLRKGTIEALRQKMYERAMVSMDSEETRELYRDLLKEEAKLKELELEGRKAAVMEEGVKLQRLRIEVQAAEKGIGRERSQRSQKGATVVVEASDCGSRNADGLPKSFESVAQRGRSLRERKCGLGERRIAGELPGPSEREFVEDQNLTGANGGDRVEAGLPKERDVTEGNSAAAGQGQGNEEKARREKLEGMWERMGEILNRGGRPEEKLLEARAVWEEGKK